MTHLFISVRSPYWDLGVMRSLAIVLANFSRMTIISVFLLFCVTARVITLVFKALNKQIVNLTEAEKILPIYLSARILNLRLEKWRRNHTLACELVDMANKCFGLVMLVTIINVFVSFVTTSFEIVSSMGNHESLPFSLLLIFVNKSILLAIVFFESYRLQSEVANSREFNFNCFSIAQFELRSQGRPDCSLSAEAPPINCRSLHSNQSNSTTFYKKIRIAQQTINYYTGEYGRDGSHARQPQDCCHGIFRRQHQTLADGKFTFIAHNNSFFLLLYLIVIYRDSIDLSIVLPFQLIGSTLTYVAILHQVAAHSK